MQVYKHASMQVSKFANMQTSIQICKCESCDVKYGYDQIGHDIAIHNYIMQSYSQLCAIDAKQFYNSGRIMQIYVG